MKSDTNDITTCTFSNSIVANLSNVYDFHSLADGTTFAVGDDSSLNGRIESSAGGMSVFSQYGTTSVATDFANGVVFGVDSNGSRVVIGGKTGLVSAGKIMYTDDGGNTWNTATLPVGITQVSRVT